MAIRHGDSPVVRLIRPFARTLRARQRAGRLGDIAPMDGMRVGRYLQESLGEARTTRYRPGVGLPFDSASTDGRTPRDGVGVPAVAPSSSTKP